MEGTGLESPDRADGLKKICSIIVHHRGRRLLDACIHSLLASDDVEVEVIIAANACEEKLPGIAEQDPRVEVVWIQNPVGFSEANNIGVRKSAQLGHQPDFYFFLNNDAKVESNTLAKLAAAVDQTPECGIVGPRLMVWGAEGHLNSLGLNVTRTGEAWDEGIGIRLDDYGTLPTQGEVLAVTGAALMIRADLCQALRGWSELYEYYFEDIDLCLRARSRGWKVLLEPDAIVWHAISATASRASEFKLSMTWRNRLLLVLSHWPLGLLCRVVPRLVFDEVRVLGSRLRVRAFDDARLQIGAWAGALGCTSGILRIRRSRGAGRQWIDFLRPVGSVPVIRLPELPAEVIQ